jgi:hypothetical protein
VSWRTLGTLQPTGDWQQFADPLSSQLIRANYVGDAVWLEKYRVRAFIRLRVEDMGYLGRWLTLWPQSGQQALWVLETLPFGNHYLEVRARRDFASLQAQYQITFEAYDAPPYQI